MRTLAAQCPGGTLSVERILTYLKGQGPVRKAEAEEEVVRRAGECPGTRSGHRLNNLPEAPRGPCLGFRLC